MTQRSPARIWLRLLAWLAVSYAPALTAAFVDTGSWYAALNRPAWTPPSWVFGPVWTLLYLLMGIAAWRIWVKRGFRDAPLALSLFLIHLIFNAAWTWLFFGQHLLIAAAVEIVILWVMIVMLVVLFHRHDRIAGLLLVPYLLWVTYASTLSIGFAAMN